ncbi:MAG: histidine kinase dimerization/phospho-acceptor domain-containing protein, partial [Bacteroidota bacterium]
ESDVHEQLENLDFSDITSQRIEDLEYELKLKNDELKNLIEELETSNEELQSSNEELTASNEELQSTNEELQSVNEELHTVNSELREKNNELQQVYYDLNHLYDTQDIATLFLDHELRIRSYTPAVTSHLSLKKSDIGRPISNFMFFDQPVRELFFREAKASVTDGKHFQETILNEEKHYLIKISPFVKEDVIDGVVITLIDVEEVAIVKDKYQKLFESTSLALQMDQMAFWEWSVERDEVVNQNDYWLELFELDSRKIRQQLDKKLHEEDKKEVWDVINNGVLRNEPYAHEFRIWNDDHTSLKWIKNRGKVIRRGKYGEPLRMLCISKDITKEKSGELELIHAKEQAERANKQKDLFLSNLSHEIRTPMNAVVGFSKLMKKSNLKKGQKELYLEQIEENSKQLLVLINDILDLSKIESGALLLQDEETDLKKLMNDIYEYYANELEGNDTISIQLREPKDATQNTTIATDPVRLKQVINNLVDNAIKYSKKGTITLGYEFTKDKVKFEIADQGYGIEKVELERIFKRFEQLADNELQSNGAGLGLAICD